EAYEVSMRVKTFGSLRGLAGLLLATAPCLAQLPRPTPDQPELVQPPRLIHEDRVPPQPPASLLHEEKTPIDLAAALQMAGVQNAEILLARERVTEAVALRQLAAAQILPSINAGTSVNVHTGPLQRSNGEILKVNRGSMYVGLGASAVGAGTVTIPG